MIKELDARKICIRFFFLFHKLQMRDILTSIGCAVGLKDTAVLEKIEPQGLTVERGSDELGYKVFKEAG